MSKNTLRTFVSYSLEVHDSHSFTLTMPYHISDRAFNVRGQFRFLKQEYMQALSKRAYILCQEISELRKVKEIEVRKDSIKIIMVDFQKFPLDFLIKCVIAIVVSDFNRKDEIPELIIKEGNELRQSDMSEFDIYIE